MCRYLVYKQFDLPTIKAVAVHKPVPSNDDDIQAKKGTTAIGLYNMRWLTKTPPTTKTSALTVHIHVGGHC